MLEDLLQDQTAVIAMEGSYSVGQLFLLEVLGRGHDVREVHPFVSKRFREALTEDHADDKDADGLAVLARWKGDLPPVRFSEEQAAYKRLSRLRTQLVRDRTRYLNRLHACLVETYGGTYKGLFKNLLSKKALQFFHQYPTVNDALAGDTEASTQVGQEKWMHLQEAGAWKETGYPAVFGQRCGLWQHTYWT
jgi:transposase